VLHVFTISLPDFPAKIILSLEHKSAIWVTKEEALNMDLIPGGHEYLKFVMNKYSL